MIPLLHSGKFWLKTLVFGGIGGLVLLVGSAVALHYAFDPNKLEQTLNGALAGTGRQVRFDHNISRSWLPRPTVTLTHVEISNPQHSRIDLHADKVKIGLSWTSLLGRPRIEKMQWQDVTADMTINAQGQSNFADILQQWYHQHQWLPINRLIIDNARIRLTDASGEHSEWRQIQGKITDLSDTDSPFEFSATWQQPGWPEIGWQVSGNRHSGRQWIWQNTRVYADTVLPYLGKTQVQIAFDGTWHNNSKHLYSSDVQWQWQSERAALHANGTGKNWQLGWASLEIPQLNAVLTGQTGGNTFNATVGISQLSAQQGLWQAAQFQIDSGWQNGLRQAAASLSGRMLRPRTGHWVLDNLIFSSHQDTINRLPNPRWLSELEGRISGTGRQAVQTEWHGTFDNQPIHLFADYQQQQHQHQLSGSLSLDQLNLGPYLQSRQNLRITPQWLQYWQQYLQNWHMQWQVQVGRVITPVIQLSDINTHIRLDAQKLLANPLQAKLYEGMGEGSLMLANTRPLQWQLQQTFHQIQIKPLLQDSLGLHNLDGQGEARLDLRGSGVDSRDWLASLNGEVVLQLQQGAMRGIDVNNILQNREPTQTTLAYNESSQTHFRRLQLNLPFSHGLSRNSRVTLSADNFDVSGLGQVNLPGQSMNYDVLITTRQNGSRNRLPLKVAGNLLRPSFSLDYQRLTAGLQTPQQKQQTLQQTLKKQWQWLNQGPASAPKTWLPKP